MAPIHPSQLIDNGKHIQKLPEISVLNLSCHHVVYGLDYNNQANIVSITSLVKRPFACICYLLLGKAVLVSGLSRSSRTIRAIKSQGHSTVGISCCC